MPQGLTGGCAGCDDPLVLVGDPLCADGVESGGDLREVVND